MSTILVAGAGKSSVYLIQFLLSNAKKYKWHVIVADGDKNAIAEKIGDHPNAEGIVLDITKTSDREALVKRADIVLSLMPPHLHVHLAKDCLKHKKNLITSSYTSEEIKKMHDQVKAAGLMFMSEMGLDPGIDHMSLNKIIYSIYRVAGSVYSIKSYCGGLVAPESDNNPWHYKFTWNPRNVITAGLGGAKYLSNGKEVTVPYEEIFDHNKKIKVEGTGTYAYYPNRDSLDYLDSYHIPDIKTFMRATLRHPAFCIGWDAFVRFGMTTYEDEFVKTGATLTSWLMEKSGCDDRENLKAQILQKLGHEKDNKVISLLNWLGFFDDIPLRPGKSSSGEILLELLNEKWNLASAEKDMVIMQHEIEYVHKGKKSKLISSMTLKGENKARSAMSKTVGYPMGILAKLILTKKITPPIGCCIPNMPEVYKPVLSELEHLGIEFKEYIE